MKTKTKEKTVVEVPKLCCEKDCRRVATTARKVSDFWLSTCDEHYGATLSINKALEQIKP